MDPSEVRDTVPEVRLVNPDSELHLKQAFGLVQSGEDKQNHSHPICLIPTS